MVLAFGDLCAFLEGIERISTRRPRYAQDKEQECIRRHVSQWFSKFREELGKGARNTLDETTYADLHPATLFRGWKTGTHGDLGRYTELAYKPWDSTFKKQTKRAIPMEKVDNLLKQLAARYRFSDPGIQKQRDWHTSTDTELRLLLQEYSTITLDEAYVFRQYHFLLPDILKFQNDFDAALRMLQGELSCFPPNPSPSFEKPMRVEAAQLLKAAVGIKVARPAFHKAWSLNHCFQLVGKRAWAAEVKYDGEYCINVEDAPSEIKIFSKNGKDATMDREALHITIRNALRIGQPDCIFKRNCIVLAEMVLYSDKEQEILSFSKIRKHIKRSGSFLGTLQDSLPHEWEHLMLVFFDVLVLDDDPIMRLCLQKRRAVLRDLVHTIPDLKQAFARSLADRQESLILKPLGTPYFPLHTEIGGYQPGYFIKLKRDYLGHMGGQRDLGDFAVIGASFDPQLAPKTDVKPLHWTHFYIGRVMNKLEIQRLCQKPRFKVVRCLSLDKQVSITDLKHLNEFGRLQEVDLGSRRSIDAFDIEHSKGYDRRMTVAFKVPFVVEILGGGYEKTQNETFELLRHPRVKKIHHDRTWEDAVSMDDLKRMAEEKWEIPDANKIDGHARDVALLVKMYRTTCTTITSSQCSGSTQGNGTRASPELRSFLIREDTSERLPVQIQAIAHPTPPTSYAVSAGSKRSFADDIVSPPSSKRRKPRTPLQDARQNRNLGAFDYDSQEKIIHIYAEEGVRVQVHSRPHSEQ
ncbi:hypothetical protein BU23DRAFT_583861 [Bimuria novae-zelandiae CBS 107.79]|uniref:ATP-dependent DNA ligase family profile domain-containing protein n=1 Tax=Bimuria novae-zelandiae CBS 107.79 TaxID=1447943 RepID=A0A6A5URY3_9PLEO|nr:hypothetical protein BU23DRAFT_583861 [Bimuria novae-zelandiae CBS 107.79]